MSRYRFSNLAGSEPEPEGFPAVLLELMALKEISDQVEDYEPDPAALSRESFEVLSDFKQIYGISQSIRRNFYLNSRSVPEVLIASYTHRREVLEESLLRTCGWDKEQTAAVLVATEHLVTNDWLEVAIEVGGGPIETALRDCPISVLQHSIAEMERITRLATMTRENKLCFQRRWEETMHASGSDGKRLKSLITVMSEAWGNA